MAFLDELGARLVAQGVGVIGTNIFYGSTAIIPTGPGPYLTLNETGGIAPVRVQNKVTPTILRPTVQIIVRATTYQAARTMVQNAYNALDGVFNSTLSSIYYLSMMARQEPTDMGLDQSGRVQLVFNVIVEKVA